MKLSLVDLETDGGITGRAYLFAIDRIAREIEADVDSPKLSREHLPCRCPSPRPLRAGWR